MTAKYVLKKRIAQSLGRYFINTPRVVVLCYHSVHPTKSFSSASPELFQAHLRWLKGHCNVINFRNIPSLVRDLSSGSRPLVAITFDDGYADNYEYAFPLLVKYDIPATFFVTAGLIEKDPCVIDRFVYLRRSNLKEITPLTWQQIKEMKKTGMEIGSHTWRHPNLARLDPSSMEEELLRSKQVLEDRLEATVDLIAYPFGKYRRHFDKITIEIAKRVGYVYGAAVAFRSVRVEDNPLAIPRFFVTRDNIDILAQKVYGYWDWLGWWQENAPIWLARLISREDFEV